MCLAAEKDGRFDVIANDAGDRVTPAIVGFNDNEVLVGISAKHLSSRKPASIATDSKGRIIDNNLDDFVVHVEGNEKKVAVKEVHTRLFKYMKGE